MSKREVVLEEPGEDVSPPIDVPAQDLIVQPPLIVKPLGNLPDATTVNPKEIKAMTLTKQGWVVPHGRE